jgi:hypothetical protein
LTLRQRHHLSRFRLGKHENSRLLADFQIYGENQFKIEILEVINDINLLITREQYWLGQYTDLYNQYIKIMADYNFNDRQIKAFWTKVDKKTDSECWNWLGAKDRNNYGVFWKTKAHRVSCYLNDKEKWNKNLIVCHKCDNPSCCNPKHLKLGSSSYNMRDCIKKNRGGNQKLTWKIVNDIRQKYITKELHNTKDFINYLDNKYQIKCAARTICSILVNQNFYDDKYKIINRKTDINFDRTLTKSTKLDWDFIYIIRELGLDCSYTYIKKLFQDKFDLNVSRQTIANIIQNKSWKIQR